MIFGCQHDVAYVWFPCLQPTEAPSEDPPSLPPPPTIRSPPPFIASPTRHSHEALGAGLGSSEGCTDGRTSFTLSQAHSYTSRHLLSPSPTWTTWERADERRRWGTTDGLGGVDEERRKRYVEGEGERGVSRKTSEATMRPLPPSPVMVGFPDSTV